MMGYDWAAEQLRAALSALEDQWQRLDAPILRALEPGISPEEIDQLAGPHGLAIPPELKVLWGWHNGAYSPEPGRLRWQMGPGGFEFHSAQACLEKYVFNRQVHASSPDPEEMPDLYWHESWLPFMTWEARRLYVDCDRLDPFGCSPVRLISREWENPSVDCAMSVAQLIRLWTWLLSQDLYRPVSFPSGDVMWEAIDWMQIPEFVRYTGLA